MAYDEVSKVPALQHKLSLEGRNRLLIDGVEDVSGFDESLVVLSTSQGDLNIRGQQLHIERIDLELGQLELKGHVQELSYDEPSEAGSLWSRLFG
ncbi:MAG: sporulation protein [Oscillospiraceae bacterium]|nr:sporulation protein [Oscillospiraceae bacterium]